MERDIDSDNIFWYLVYGLHRIIRFPTSSLDYNPWSKPHATTWAPKNSSSSHTSKNSNTITKNRSPSKKHRTSHAPSRKSCPSNHTPPSLTPPCLTPHTHSPSLPSTNRNTPRLSTSTISIKAYPRSTYAEIENCRRNHRSNKQSSTINPSITNRRS